MFTGEHSWREYPIPFAGPGLGQGHADEIQSKSLVGRPKAVDFSASFPTEHSEDRWLLPKALVKPEQRCDSSNSLGTVGHWREGQKVTSDALQGSFARQLFCDGPHGAPEAVRQP